MRGELKYYMVSQSTTPQHDIACLRDVELRSIPIYGMKRWEGRWSTSSPTPTYELMTLGRKIIWEYEVQFRYWKKDFPHFGVIFQMMVDVWVLWVNCMETIMRKEWEIMTQSGEGSPNSQRITHMRTLLYVAICVVFVCSYETLGF
jgi:hypothetical protein